MDQLIVKYGLALGVALFIAGLVVGGFFSEFGKDLYHGVRTHWERITTSLFGLASGVIWIYGNSRFAGDRPATLQDVFVAFTLVMLGIACVTVMVFALMGRTQKIIGRIIGLFEHQVIPAAEKAEK